MKLTAQDLALFIGQEVEIEMIDSNRQGKLVGVSELWADVWIDGKIPTQCSYDEVKPICRKYDSSITTKEDKEYFDRWTDDYLLETNNTKREKALYDLKIWLASIGICPFEEWFEQGLVIERVKEHA